jgi:energy-coupling factor transporter transmembrane protein EcfT
LHPSIFLLAWLATVLAVQFLGYPGLAIVALAILLSAPGARLPWLTYARRARWLLVMLWLILAYNTPGEAMQDLAWAPTYEGTAEANLQAARLLVMLGSLAWLFNRLGREGLVGALWALLLPLAKLGLDSERLVVRLSLVLENLQLPPKKGAWKKMLDDEPDYAVGPKVLHFSQSAWRTADTLAAALIGAVFLGASLL